MFQEFYSHSSLLFLPLIALVLFIGSFSIAVFYAVRHSKSATDDASQLPLFHDDVNDATIVSPEGGRHV